HGPAGPARTRPSGAPDTPRPHRGRTETAGTAGHALLPAPPSTSASAITNPARNCRELYRNTDADSGIRKRHAGTAFLPLDLRQATTVPSESQNELPTAPPVQPREQRGSPGPRRRTRR